MSYPFESGDVVPAIVTEVALNPVTEILIDAGKPATSSYPC